MTQILPEPADAPTSDASDSTDVFALPQRPSDMLQPWEGVLEMIPDDEAQQMAPVGPNRVRMLDDTATDDILWTPSGLDQLRTLMATTAEDRLDSAGNEFVVLEGVERRAMRSVRQRLLDAQLPETLISDVTGHLQAELELNETLEDRALVEIARYRMRSDGSALTRVHDDPNWPLLIQTADADA